MTRQRLQVNRPGNFVLHRDEYLFNEENSHFDVAPLILRQLTDVFVTNGGYCLDKDGLVKEFHHAYPDQQQSYLTYSTLLEENLKLMSSTEA
jgi:hypothetical protein